MFFTTALLALSLNSDSLHPKYVNDAQLCNTLSVTNKYVELEFDPAGKFTLYVSYAKGLNNLSNGKVYSGTYKISENTVIIYPSKEHESIPDSITYLITAGGVKLFEGTDQTFFPSSLTKPVSYQEQNVIADSIYLNSGNRRFYYQYTSCNSMWTNTYWWELELKKDSSFYLSHSSFNNMNSAPNNPISKRVKKNPTLPDIISGKWKQSSDSIELTYIKAFAGLNQIFNESIILVDLGNTLMLKRNDNFSSFPSKMDLAMPKRNMISN